jgi:elongator complex protein 3
MKKPLENEIRKPTKTLAGVTPIAVVCKPKKCKHGTCTYCPSLNVPQSYTPKSPPVLRAERLNYNAYEQVKSRLNAFKVMNHPTGKIELIIMGGNFLDYPSEYKIKLIKDCFDALNGKKSRSLEEAKRINEKAKHRCVALCIESRPDTICQNKNSISELLDYGCTRVELGVQCLDDKIYQKINRGHGVKEVIEATKMLREAGFKIGYHFMIGLPGSNIHKDINMFEKLFSDSNFKPDQLKIYPCQIIKGAVLEKDFEKGKYKPYSEDKIKRTIIQMMKIIPRYCRVMRIMREIPPDYLVKGTLRIDLRKDIEDEIRKTKLNIKEIRFREIGFKIRDSKKIEKIQSVVKLKLTTYLTSSGKEYFIEAVNKQNILFGLCRLNINKENKKAIIRELHVYGQSLNVGDNKTNSFQHKGMGKSLMDYAEKICLKENIKEIYVISGVGAREYYKKIGYSLKGSYMYKRLMELYDN